MKITSLRKGFISALFGISVALAFGHSPAYAVDSDAARSMKTAKMLFDGKVDPITALNSTQRDCSVTGMACQNSVDCCGEGMCHNGFCDGEGPLPTQCVPNGGHCEDSVECCGGNMCNSSRHVCW